MVEIIVLRSNKIDPGYVQFSIEHGTEMAMLSAEDFRTAMRERDMLRAEREVWGNIAQERNDLRAEVERLRAIAEAAREFHNFKRPSTHRVLNPTCRLCVALDAWSP